MTNWERRPPSTGASGKDGDKPDTGRQVVAEFECELSNILTVVSGWVEWLHDPGRSESERNAAARSLRTAVDRMRIALYRLSSGPNEKPHGLAIVDVNEVVESILRSLDPRVRANFKLQSNTNPALWPVIADVRALDYVLVSLVMSAVCAGEPGDSILIETANLESGEAAELSQGVLAERYVRISVRDLRGWQPAYSDAGVSGLLAGGNCPTGIAQGLPISRQIVEQHAGVMQITSRPGLGTNAIVLLPACPPQQSWGCPTSEAHGRLLR